MKTESKRQYLLMCEVGDMAFAQDQDTAVGDAFVECYAMIDSAARNINAAVEKNDLGTIDVERIRKAEKAWYFASGMKHALGLDDPVCLEALEYMRKCVHSIQVSRENGFQTKVYVMPEAMERMLNFQYFKALPTAESFFSDVKAPTGKWLREAQDRTDGMKEGVCAYMRDVVTNEPTTVGTCSDDAPGLKTDMSPPMEEGSADAAMAK